MYKYFIIGFSILLFLFIGWVVIMFYVAKQVWLHTLVKSKYTKWGRECSSDEKEQIEMFESGVKWVNDVLDKGLAIKHELHLTSEGLDLVGEYIDTRASKTAVILQGRTESLLYSYYFAKPYFDSDYNILVIDPRGHGLSEGKYNSAGLVEYKDVIKWINLVKEKFGVTYFVIHGVCIGGATGIYAYINSKPDGLIKKLVVDGLYSSFYLSFKNHIIGQGKPVFPVLQLVMGYYVKKYQHVNMKKGPIDYINQIDIPILFLHSYEDIYSTPDQTAILYDMCASKNKKIVWFNKGEHSRVRINNLDKYDEEITKFLQE